MLQQAVQSVLSGMCTSSVEDIHWKTTKCINTGTKRPNPVSARQSAAVHQAVYGDMVSNAGVNLQCPAQIPGH